MGTQSWINFGHILFHQSTNYDIASHAVTRVKCYTFSRYVNTYIIFYLSSLEMTSG